jgi:hypothetical protein
LYRFIANSPTNATDPSGLWTPEGMLKAFEKKYGEEGRKLLKVALQDHVTIDTDNNTYYWSSWEFDKASRTIIIAEKTWSGWFAAERSDQDAADRLHDALNTYYCDWYGVKLAKGALHLIAHQAHDIENSPLDAELHLGMKEAMDENRAFATLMANDAGETTKAEVGMLASAWVEGLALEAAVDGLIAWRRARALRAAGEILPRQGVHPRISEPPALKPTSGPRAVGLARAEFQAAEEEVAASKSFRDRPRSNSDARVKYQSEPFARPRPEPFRPSDYEALKRELDAYKGAQGPAKDAAGEALGLKATERYMESPDVGAKQVYRQQTVNGNLDFDRVYKNESTYYVTEAKAPNARLTAREVPGEFQPNGDPWYAMEGSGRYLDDTLTAMRKSGNKESVRIAEELQAARKAGNVKYIQVTVRPRANCPNDLYFSVTEYKLPKP